MTTLTARTREIVSVTYAENENGQDHLRITYINKATDDFRIKFTESYDYEKDLTVFVEKRRQLKQAYSDIINALHKGAEYVEFKFD